MNLYAFQLKKPGVKEYDAPVFFKFKTDKQARGAAYIVSRAARTEVRVTKPQSITDDVQKYSANYITYYE